ncbi:phospholipid-binding lipoprotein MlaA [Marinospirillum celere]|uniref:Phospholipid-binding lipoprotein MlaA n=1 Tax=Marinospirillum celere TaxID=1122252 RepID=A0A1I1EA62_9GAMM|nr:VacJ family lipoprotein [Marinospirillum celere]SFB81910.1 phospholipid-binding lipoprotein MlaA [Marinospirillum celere]
MKKAAWLLVLLLLLTGCAAQQEIPESVEGSPEEEEWEAHPRDPFENWNRRVFAFNETLDAWIIKPTAKGYKAVTPQFARTGVRNFFNNLREISQFTNNLLQVKPAAASKDAVRFALNTTLGLAGFLDVATPLGLPRSQEDFGQTLSVWGVPEGPYVVLPVFGGQTLTHAVSLPIDYRLNPMAYIDHPYIEYSLWGVYGIQVRSDLLEAEQLIMGDRYSFIRDAYLQRRTFLINDGKMGADPFLDDDFDDFDFDDAFSD